MNRICKNCYKPEEDHFTYPSEYYYIKEPFWCIEGGRTIYNALFTNDQLEFNSFCEKLSYEPMNNLEYLEWKHEKNSVSV
jgi:hypothetical protein